jgi:hypothetical protein
MKFVLLFLALASLLKILKEFQATRGVPPGDSTHLGGSHNFRAIPKGAQPTNWLGLLPETTSEFLWLRAIAFTASSEESSRF